VVPPASGGYDVSALAGVPIAVGFYTTQQDFGNFLKTATTTTMMLLLL
jgi:hypothetical protein